MKNNLVIDSKALEAMGLVSEEIWLIEYDLPSPIRNQHTKDPKLKYKAGMTEKQAKALRKIRNALVFGLKFKLKATENLFSSWLIPKEKLEDAKKICLKIRSELEDIGLKRYAEKVRIFRVFTDEEGFETFQDRKAEFLLEFLEQSQKQVDRGLKDKIMSESVLWRCKKAVEIVSATSETLKGNARFKELIDTLGVLGDTIARYENLKLKKRAKKSGSKAQIKKVIYSSGKFTKQP